MAESTESRVSDSSRYPEEHPTRGRSPKGEVLVCSGLVPARTGFPPGPGRQRQEVRRHTRRRGLRAASWNCVIEKFLRGRGDPPAHGLGVAPPRGEEDLGDRGKGRALTCLETQESRWLEQMATGKEQVGSE